MSIWRWLGTGVLALTWPGAVWACWDAAAARYQINPALLYAIAQCESGMRPTVVNRSHSERTGTYDIGLMQVNSSHLGRLGTFGIDERALFEVCTNIQVGAWILADKIRRHGFSWEAVGAYNAACTQLKGSDCVAARSKYAWCVYRQLAATSAAGMGAAGTPSLTHAARAMPIIATRVGP